MIDLDNQTDLNINLEKLEDIAQELSQQDIEVLIVDDSTIQALNAQYRNKNTATDVLSFPLDNPFGLDTMPLGTILIASSFVEDKAEVFSHSIEDECTLLFIHGLLHLLGFDHESPDDKGKMRAKEKSIIEKFALPQSLIIRNTDQ